MDCPANNRKRSETTRRKIIAAFTRLVFAEGFENVSVGKIVTAAQVARSTFYEHFSGKEDVLCASMSHLFQVIADCVRSTSEPTKLLRVLNHLWENRRLADAIFSGTPRVILSRALSEMIEARLHEAHEGRPLTLPYRLAAIHIAEGQLALVESWLRGRAFCGTRDLAVTLHKTSQALAMALSR